VQFFIGMLLFGLLAQMVPDEHGHSHDEKKHESSSEDEHDDDSSASSGDQPTTRTLRSRKPALADNSATKAKPTKEQKTEQKRKSEAVRQSSLSLGLGDL
jgi:zinc transporter ZupT